MPNDTISADSKITYSFDFEVPNVQPLDVTPTTEEQIINAPAGVSGYSPVNVGAVDSAIDLNIIPENIREGVEILGVEGDLIELKGQEKTVNPATSTQNITPDANFNGLTKVTVNAVTSSIDSDIKPQNIREGIEILGVEGSVIELKGEEKIVNLSNKDGQTFTPTGENNGIISIHVNPKNKNVTIQPQTVSQTIGIDDGYSGNGNITVNAVTKTIDTNIQSYNIKQGVEVLGVQGSVVELEGEDKTVNLTNKQGQTFYPSNGNNGLTSLTVIPNNENRTINPSTEFKTVEINEGYSGNGTLAVMPVTNQIDSNIKPQNIKQGVKILGVTGSMPTVVNNTELTVNPSTEEQIITPAGNYTGFDEVTVNPVTNEIDENITANNIKDGVTILGVTGEVVELNADSLSVTPTTSAQTITPTSPINGFNEVNVSAVTSSIDSNIIAGNIKSGVTILGVQGTVTELDGETKSVSLTNSAGQTFTPTSPKNAITSITVTPNNEARTVTPTTSQQSLSVNSGYSGNGTITVNAVTSSIDSNIIAGNIKSGVTILGVSGTVTELNGETKSVSLTNSAGQTFTPTSPKNAITSITVTPNNQARTVTPTTSQQSLTVNTGYSGNGTITVNAVTSDIDSDIKATNIKSGVNILGVNGSVVELNGSSRSVSLTSSSGQTFNPESGKNAITSITVTPNNQTRTVTPTTSQQSLSVNSGYSGNGTITVNAVTSSIDQNIQPENIKKDVVILGTTGTYEGSGGIGITREVSANGTYQMPASDFTFSLPSNAIDVGKNALYFAFYYCTSLTSVDLSSLTKISGNSALYSAFQNCSYLTTVDLSSLTTVSGMNTFRSAFQICTSLTSVDLSSLTTVSGNYAFQYAFAGCTSLTSVDLSSLQIIGEEVYSSYQLNVGQFSSCFSGCNNLTSISFPNLEKIYCTGDSTAFYGTFANNDKIEKLYFPKLDTITYGTGAGSTNQNACKVVFSGCSALTELHFGAANQAAIEASSGYSTAWGRGAGNVTIYFDL